ncbi:hypothetical protein Plhal304r1_c005g0020071 [Plasmopara halstedii]
MTNHIQPVSIFFEVLLLSGMPINIRDLLWPLAAVAGTTTAAIFIFKYATRRVRDHRDNEIHSAVDTQDCEDMDDELISEDELAEILDTQQSDLEMVNQERRVILVMFGLMLTVLVIIVSLLIVWNNENSYNSIVELPLFQPLIWIAFGIITAAQMDLSNGKKNAES